MVCGLPKGGCRRKHCANVPPFRWRRGKNRYLRGAGSPARVLFRQPEKGGHSGAGRGLPLGIGRTFAMLRAAADTGAAGLLGRGRSRCANRTSLTQRRPVSAAVLSIGGVWQIPYRSPPPTPLCPPSSDPRPPRIKPRTDEENHELERARMFFLLTYLFGS